MSGPIMEGKFTVRLRQEGEWYVAQALGVDVASQERSEEETLANLREAVELHIEPPVPIVKRSCEEVFEAFQGKVVFMEDVNAPTMGEWPQV